MGEWGGIGKTYVTDPCHTHVVASCKDIWRRTEEKGDDRTVSKGLNCPRIFVSVVISLLSSARHTDSREEVGNRTLSLGHHVEEDERIKLGNQVSP